MEHVETAQVDNLPQSTRSVPASCVEAIQQQCVEKGFSEKVAIRIARAQKPSTLGVYQGKWGVFTGWCEGRDAGPFTATPQLIADFLLYLHEERKLVYSTIEGYRTAINHVVKGSTGVDIGRSVEI